MPFDFFADAASSVDFGSLADFGDVSSVVDASGSEFLADIGAVGSDLGSAFDVPISDLASLDAWAEVGSFAGDGAWFDTFNSGAITDFASSVSSGATGFFDSISSSLPSLSSIKDFAGSVGDSISAGFNAVTKALPSLDKIKSVASTVSKTVGEYTKDAQKVLAAYNKVAPAVNAASAALGIQNPVSKIIQPLTQAVGIASATSSAAGGVASGISGGQSFGQKVSDFFGPSQTEKAETYNQAKQTVESTDAALKQYDAERETYTADIVRSSDNIYAIQSKLEDPNISEEERVIAEEQLKGEYDKLATTQQALEQTNSAASQVASARDSAAKIVATTDANTVKVADAVQTKQTITNYNEAVSTVDSTNKALKQYDAQRASATQDILAASDNISAIQAKLDDPDLPESERKALEFNLKGQYDELAVAQRSLEQTNTAAEAVTAARDQAAQVVAGTNLNTLKTPFQVDSSGLVILDAKQTAELEKNLNPAFVNSFVDPATAQRSENYNQAKATVESTNAALKQYDAEKAAYTADIVKSSDNIYNINQRLNDPNTSAEERALLEEQLQSEYTRLAETQQALEQTNAAADAVTAARDQAAQVIASTDSNLLSSAAAVATSGADQFKTAYDSVTKTWSVFDTRTGQTIQTGLTEQQAILAGQDLNLTSGISLNSTAAAVVGAVAGTSAAATVTKLFTGPDGATAANSITGALTNQARAQQSVRELRNTKAQSTDWRVRLKLAPNSTYLYNDPSPGILAALRLTDGVIFPYTPSIETAYKANYDQYDLTHSNYRGYFYKGSYVDAVNVRGTFTAQDTKEADYLLAVIHFFRSCTKMFYGKDTQRGAPPPLVYLNGYGDYQFAEHPCVVSQFNYTLPPDVDYIRCQSTLQNSTNRLNSRLRNPLANNPLSYSVNRLLNSNLVQGALSNAPVATTGNLASSTPTYVPTKMEISITLLPVQSRSQISNNFSVKEFANGNLLKGGYW